MFLILFDRVDVCASHESVLLKSVLYYALRFAVSVVLEEALYLSRYKSLDLISNLVEGGNTL
jgi:hypothetical protein